jgi:hypothetical protein
MHTHTHMHTIACTHLRPLSCPHCPQVVRQDDGSYTAVNSSRDVVQLLQDLGNFNTLLAALKARARWPLTRSRAGRCRR